jgi:signal peptidase I
MQRTVQWQWPAFVSKKQALIDVLFLGFHNAEPQILLGCLVALGVLYTIFNRRYLWLSVSYAIFCVLYMLAASTESSAKAFLTGFWYHDSYRLGASAVILAIGLAGVGANVLIIASQKLLNGIIANLSDEKNSALFTCIVVLTIAGVNFFPSYYLFERQTVVTPFGAIRRDITYTNSAKTPKSYTDAEREFVKRVKGIVGDSLVLNQPYDGSVYAYGADSLNVYYKAWEGNWMGLPTRDNELISMKLNQISTSDDVQKAVKNSGSQYLMLLDRQDYRVDSDDSSLILSDFQHYRRAVWAGLDAINDDTPGFQKIISQGNMRLYKITVD